MGLDFAKKNENGCGENLLPKARRTQSDIRVEAGAHMTTYVDRHYLKEIGDCKVVTGGSVARQHWMVVCRMTLVVRKS